MLERLETQTRLTVKQWKIVAQRFFDDASYAIIGPYTAHLKASGMGVGYGTGNIGKVIGPLGLALIVAARSDACPT